MTMLPPRLRFEVLRRDGFRCQYCGQAAPYVGLEVDHRVPVAKGGTDAHENLVTACWTCNRGKGDVPLGDDAINPMTTANDEPVTVMLPGEHAGTHVWIQNADGRPAPVPYLSATREQRQQAIALLRESAALVAARAADLEAKEFTLAPFTTDEHTTTAEALERMQQATKQSAA